MDRIVDFVINVFKTMMSGAVVLILGFFYGIHLLVMGVGESNIPTSNVEAVQISSVAEDHDYHWQVYSKARIVSDQKISDFDVTYNIYDCPSTEADISNCTLVKSEESDFEDVTVPGVPYEYTRNLWVYEVPKGVFVGKLSFANFQG